MKQVEYLILGGGITGLSLAYHLKDREYALYEAADRVGGVCKTEHVNDFLFDYGEHFIRADDTYVRTLIGKLLGSNLRSQVLNAAVYLKGHTTNYPFQTNLYGLPPSIVKECLVGYIKAWCKQGGRRKETGNFEEWIYANLGDAIATHFMIPYNEKIWAMHPRHLTTDWFFSESVVPKGDLRTVVDGALRRRKAERRMRWYPIKGGIEALARSFLRFTKNVHVNKKAVEVNLARRRVVFEDGETVGYKCLLNTLPLPELINIVQEVPSGVHKTSRKLKYNSVLCVNLGVARKKLSDRHWIYYPEKEPVFARAYFMSNFSPRTVPRGASSVTAMITYAKWKPIDKKRIVERVIDDLGKVGILRKDDTILTTSVLDMKYGFNIYTKDRATNVEKIKKYLFANNVHTLGRYGNWEYSGIEHAILNSRRLVESFNRQNS